MKIDILFALPGPLNPAKGDKLLVVAAATEHEDPGYLDGVIAEVAETALEAGAYRALRKVTLELDDSLILAVMKEAALPMPSSLADTKMRPAFLN